MDVVRLGLPGDTTYMPDALVEGYNSMIWTERHVDPGDFQLKTSLIDETMDLLPEGALISHLETEEVAAVENRIIGVDDNGLPELTITGRSLTFFPENRHVEASYQKNRKMIREYRPAGAAAVLLWNAFDNNSGYDHTRLGQKAWTIKDRIPNVAIVDSVPTSVGNQRRWHLKEGPLYPQLYNVLLKGDLGLRMVRPPSKSMKVVSVGNDWLTVTNHSGGVEVSSQQMEGGAITRTATDTSSLVFELYYGTDRSSSVIFSVTRGDFEKMQYLFSVQSYKTAMEVMSSVAVSDVYRNTDQEAYTGLDRRVGSYDAGSPELPDEPEKPERPDDPKSTATQAEKDQFTKDLDAWRDAMDVWRPKHADWALDRDSAIADFKADAEDDAQRELKKTRRVSLFTGDISPYAGFKYKTDYDLGDTVLLQGDYNQSQKLIVSEYVRTEDADGDRGYPGLVLP